MPRISILLTDEIASLAESGLKKQDRTGTSRNKVKLLAIIAAKKHGIKKAAKLYSISPVSITSWIHRLREESLEGLNCRSKRPNLFTPDHHKAIKNWLINDNTVTINALRIRIEKELGIKACKASVHNVIHKLGFTYVKLPPGYHKGSLSKLKKESTQNYWRLSKA